MRCAKAFSRLSPTLVGGQRDVVRPLRKTFARPLRHVGCLKQTLERGFANQALNGLRQGKSHRHTDSPTSFSALVSAPNPTGARSMWPCYRSDKVGDQIHQIPPRAPGQLQLCMFLPDQAHRRSAPLRRPPAHERAPQKARRAVFGALQHQSRSCQPTGTPPPALSDGRAFAAWAKAIPTDAQSTSFSAHERYDHIIAPPRWAKSHRRTAPCTSQAALCPNSTALSERFQPACFRSSLPREKATKREPNCGGGGLRLRCVFCSNLVGVLTVELASRLGNRACLIRGIY